MTKARIQVKPTGMEAALAAVRERIESDWERAFWGQFQVSLEVPVRKATITVEAAKRATQWRPKDAQEMLSGEGRGRPWLRERRPRRGNG